MGPLYPSQTFDFVCIPCIPAPGERRENLAFGPSGPLKTIGFSLYCRHSGARSAPQKPFVCEPSGPLKTLGFPLHFSIPARGARRDNFGFWCLLISRKTNQPFPCGGPALVGESDYIRTSYESYFLLPGKAPNIPITISTNFPFPLFRQRAEYLQ